MPIGQHDDCGLLAIRNATLDDSLNLDGLLGVMRPLQEDLEESVVSADTNFLEEGTGNFNGIGLMHYLESRGYACVLGRTHMSDLLELLCLSLTSRVVGVVWHEGSKTTGHWLCASYSHSEVDFNRRAWFHKDSVGPQGSRQGRASPGPAALGPLFFAGPGSPGPAGPRCSQPCRVRAGPRAMKEFKWTHSSDSDL